jgi:hypothetical protein
MRTSPFGSKRDGWQRETGSGVTSASCTEEDGIQFDSLAGVWALSGPPTQQTLLLTVISQVVTVTVFQAWISIKVITTDTVAHTESGSMAIQH